MKNLSIALISLSLGACSSEFFSNRYSTNEANNQLPTATVVDMQVNMTDDQRVDDQTEMGMTVDACQDCPSTGSWYRFSSLKVTALNQNPQSRALPILNSLWQKDIENNFLNVMFQIESVENGQIKIKALNAALLNAESGEYCLLDETATIDTTTQFTFSKDGCDFNPLDPSGINIYAGSTEIPKNCGPNLATKHSIPVRNVLLSGKFSDSCSRLIEGKVSNAAIPGNDLNGICTCLATGNLDMCEGIDPNFSNGSCDGCGARYTALSTQLMLFGESPNDRCPVNGENAICIDASFEAEKLDFTPTACPR